MMRCNDASRLLKYEPRSNCLDKERFLDQCIELFFKDKNREYHYSYLDLKDLEFCLFQNEHWYVLTDPDDKHKYHTLSCLSRKDGAGKLCEFKIWFIMTKTNTRQLIRHQVVYRTHLSECHKPETRRFLKDEIEINLDEEEEKVVMK
jgi:hypothetical protein